MKPRPLSTSFLPKVCKATTAQDDDNIDKTTGNDNISVTKPHTAGNVWQSNSQSSFENDCHLPPPPSLFGNEDISPEAEDNRGDYIDEDDEGEIFAKNLNGIILQYLESCGLTETYTTFYDECKSSGMLIPSHFKAEIESGVSLQDVETLLMHFDQENGDALLEFWDVLINMIDVNKYSQEIEKIAFYIQVYIALIPFRQKLSDEKKAQSFKKLRDYFQTKSEECTTDKEMLSLFALPFVSDPESHPVYGKLFQAVWVKKLRSRVKSLGRALCAPNKLITRENTDLAKMFTECSRAIPHEIDSANGKKICVLSNCRKVRFTSGVTLPSTSSDRESAEDKFSPSELFQRLNDLVVENERYKVEESKYEKQCSQLLNVSLLLAQSLEEAAQGKEVNMDKLRYEVNQCLPLSMQTDSGRKPKLQSPPKSSSDNASTCYESDASNADGKDEEDIQKETEGNDNDN